jgi:hypothetical protein
VNPEQRVQVDADLPLEVCAKVFGIDRGTKVGEHDEPVGAAALGLHRDRGRLVHRGVGIQDPFEFLGRDLDPAEVHGVVAAPLGAIEPAGQARELIAVPAEHGVARARWAPVEIDRVVVAIEQRLGQTDGWGNEKDLALSRAVNRLPRFVQQHQIQTQRRQREGGG